MTIVNTHEAKTRLSELLRRVEAGEEIVIGRGGRPIAKLIPYRGNGEPRPSGTLRGQIWISEDFDDELPEEIRRAFYGEDESEE